MEEQIEKTKENTTFVVNETKRANSYEFGKAGNRFKVYFETAKDLKEKVEALEKLEFGVVKDAKLEYVS